jgi:hypothetical protein
MSALWWAVIVSGFYHGINPGMGWPLAVSAALMERKHSALPKAIAMLGLGHFLAMLCILLPFSMMVFLIEREKEIRMVAGAMVIAMGIYLLINRRHPRILARVHPARLVLWSFLAAMAHGAGLMLVPIYLELCQSGGTQHAVVSEGHAAAQALMDSSVMTAFIVALVHTVAMTAAGALLAVVIYRWLGLKFISRTWFNLDIFWAISLIVVGLFGVYSAHAGQGH